MKELSKTLGLYIACLKKPRLVRVYILEDHCRWCQYVQGYFIYAVYL